MKHSPSHSNQMSSEYSNIDKPVSGCVKDAEMFFKSHFAAEVLEPLPNRVSSLAAWSGSR